MTYKGIEFTLGGYTPRKNEFEKGLKYRLYVNDQLTGYCFSSKKRAVEFIKRNYWLWF